MKIRFIGGPLHSLVVNVGIVKPEDVDQSAINCHPKPTPSAAISYGTASLNGEDVDIYHESLMKKGKV